VLRIIIGILILAGLSPNSAALDAGVAACDITPDIQTYRVPLAGYGAREGAPSTGVHDPLKAKVLFLRDGDTRMALVACDLRSVTPELKAKVLEATGELGLTADSLLMCASHTHAGPSFFLEEFWQLQFGKHDPRIVEHMSAAIAGALKQAAESAAPAKVGFGQTDIADFSRNRRWRYDQQAREAAGEEPCLAHRLWAMRIDSEDGQCRAAVVNFATHPTIMGADNMLVSAEWPGVLQREMENELSGATVLYTNGAEGDQAPRADDTAEGFDRVERFGRRLAEQATRLVRSIETRPGLAIAYARATPDLPPLQFSPGAAQDERFTALEPAARAALPRKAELGLLRIGNVALIGLPGEPLCEVGQAVEARIRETGFENAITLGLANDYVGYIVNAKEYAHGGYEVDARSYYGPGLGDFMADQASILAATIAP
jgi:neutral ceramidase